MKNKYFVLSLICVLLYFLFACSNAEKSKIFNIEKYNKQELDVSDTTIYEKAERYKSKCPRLLLTDNEHHSLMKFLKDESWNQIAKIMHTLFNKYYVLCLKKKSIRLNSQFNESNILYNDAIFLNNLEPHILFIAALSFLATNDNNNSAILLYHPISNEFFVEWKEWAIKYRKRNPHSNIANFFIGDAHSRLNEFKNAKKMFNKVLKSQNSSKLLKCMAYNSLGVINWINDNKQESWNYFNQATTSCKKFADPWVNLGVISLKEESLAEYTKEKFEKALQIDKSNGMAINGVACSEASSGEPKETILSQLKKADKNLPFIKENKQIISDKADSVIKINGARGFEGFKMGADLSAFGQKFGNAIVEVDWNSEKGLRGGVYARVKNGENLVIQKENAKTQVLVTWFIINYPMILDRTFESQTH